MSLIITLILVGILLLIIEILVIPGVGLAGILGLLSIVGGVVLSFIQYDSVTGFVVSSITAVALVIMVVLILRSKTWKKLTLKDNIDARVDSVPEEKGLVAGIEGITISRLAPAGKVRFGNIDVEARSYDTVIDSGKRVVIIAIEDNKIVVKQI